MIRNLQPLRFLFRACVGALAVALWSCDKGAESTGTPGESPSADHHSEGPTPGDAGEGRPQEPTPDPAGASEGTPGTTTAGRLADTSPPAPVPAAPPAAAPPAAPGAAAAEARDPAAFEAALKEQEARLAEAFRARDPVAFHRSFIATTELYGGSISSFYAALSAVSPDLQREPEFAADFINRLAGNPEAPAMAASFAQSLGDPRAKREWLQSLKDETLRTKAAELAGINP